MQSCVRKYIYIYVHVTRIIIYLLWINKFHFHLYDRCPRTSLQHVSRPRICTLAALGCRKQVSYINWRTKHNNLPMLQNIGLLLTFSLRHGWGVFHSWGKDHGSWHQRWPGGDWPRAVHWRWYCQSVRSQECAGWGDGGILIWTEGKTCPLHRLLLALVFNVDVWEQM